MITDVILNQKRVNVCEHMVKHTYSLTQSHAPAIPAPLTIHPFPPKMIRPTVSLEPSSIHNNIVPKPSDEIMFLYFL